MKRFILVLFGMLSLNVAFASTSKFNLTRFRLDQYSLLQHSGVFNNTFTGELSWNPTYALDSEFGLVGHLGIAALPYYKNEEFFPGVDTILFLSLPTLYSFRLEVGPGATHWLQHPDWHTSFLVSSNLHYQFGFKSLSWLDSVFLGYSRVFQDPKAHIVRMGVQIAL